MRSALSVFVLTGVNIGPLLYTVKYIFIPLGDYIEVYMNQLFTASEGSYTVLAVKEVPWHEGDVVRKLRMAAGWKLKHLHGASGVSVKVLNDLEMGHTKEAKGTTLTKIAKAFGLSLRDFRDLVPAAVVRFDVPSAAPKQTQNVKTKKRA